MLLGDQADAGDTKPIMLSLAGLTRRTLAEIATRTFVPVGATVGTPLGIAAWSAAHKLPTPVDSSGPAAVYMQDIRKVLH